MTINISCPRHWLIVTLLIVLPVALTVWTVPAAVFAQRSSSGPIRSHSTRGRTPPEKADPKMVERAIGMACTERESDPMGSLAIDAMQGRPSLPPAHPEAVAGAARAARLLPIARSLVEIILRRLAVDYGVSRLGFHAVAARIDAVRIIRPDMDERDNATVRFHEPHTITFGTIFLSGLRSDEAMVSVLAHELTHIADGENRALRPLYTLVARRASLRTGLRISGQRSEELTCDLVGIRATRAFIARTPGSEALSRRLARAIEHNCVHEDSRDNDHLSPRNTMRALLELDIPLARELTEGVPAENP